ncbi:hypothetical protein Hanom_Chr04g00301811 [Helianthus anomalus]
MFIITSIKQNRLFWRTVAPVRRRIVQRRVTRPGRFESNRNPWSELNRFIVVVDERDSKSRTRRG